MQQLTLSKKYEKEFSDYVGENYIKPWSLKNYKVNLIYLDCTINDIKTYWNQDARFREGFYIDKENNIVSIPNFFVKIDGVYNSKKEYKELLKLLTNDSIIIEDLPIGDFCYLNLNEYILNYLNEKLVKLKKHEKENIMYYLNNMDESIFQKLNNWDFAFEVPKIIVKNIKDVKSFIQFLEFLNSLGFDILFLSPEGNKVNAKNLTSVMLDKFENKIDKKNKTEIDFSFIDDGASSLVVYLIIIMLSIIILILLKNVLIDNFQNILEKTNTMITEIFEETENNEIVVESSLNSENSENIENEYIFNRIINIMIIMITFIITLSMYYIIYKIRNGDII